MFQDHIEHIMKRQCGVHSGVWDAEDSLQTSEDVDTPVEEADPRVAGFQKKLGKSQSSIFSGAHDAQNL